MCCDLYTDLHGFKVSPVSVHSLYLYGMRSFGEDGKGEFQAGRTGVGAPNVQ
jgi:hypothetical protein